MTLTGRVLWAGGVAWGGGAERSRGATDQASLLGRQDGAWAVCLGVNGESVAPAPPSL